MQWVSSLQTAEDFEDAVADAIAALTARLTGAPDLVLAFVAPQHRERWQALPRVLRGHWPGVRVVGCSGGGVLADGHEVEQAAGIALVAAILPGVAIRPFHLRADQAPEGGDRLAWATALDLDLDLDGPPPALLLLPDPFSFPIDRTVLELDAAFPEATVFGGLISGGRAPGEHALFFDDHTYEQGMVGVALSGNLTVQTVVAQGCKPVGEPMFVTAADGRVLRQLDGHAATDMVQRAYAGMDADDRVLARQSLFLGLGMRPGLETYDRGDFLIRHIVGADADAGTLISGAPLQVNQVVQFHLRDAKTSADDITHLLDRARRTQDSPPAGALLFSCLGRGAGLYGRPDFDSEAIREALGAHLPLAGFFCNGELGPLQGRTWQHGYTSVIALFRPATPG